VLLPLWLGPRLVYWLMLCLTLRLLLTVPLKECGIPLRLSDRLVLNQPPVQVMRRAANIFLQELLCVSLLSLCLILQGH
jgi:hypothetical protein